MSSLKKKKKQLGMNPSTASHRLVKDILWNFIVYAGRDRCFRCGKKMTRETFSIEHKAPWLDSEDPVGLFFDIDNISFSHNSCNYSASRKSKDWKKSMDENYNKYLKTIPPGKSWCCCCKQYLDISLFGKSAARKSGLATECKQCRKNRNKNI